MHKSSFWPKNKNVWNWIKNSNSAYFSCLQWLSRQLGLVEVEVHACHTQLVSLHFKKIRAETSASGSFDLICRVQVWAQVHWLWVQVHSIQYEYQKSVLVQVPSTTSLEPNLTGTQQCQWCRFPWKEEGHDSWLFSYITHNPHHILNQLPYFCQSQQLQNT